MPFYSLTRIGEDATGGQCSGGGRVVVQGQNLEIALVHYYEANMGSGRHQHPSEQMIYVLKGRLQARVGDTVVVANAGDIIHVPSNVEHEVLALEQADAVSFKNVVYGRGSPSE